MKLYGIRSSTDPEVIGNYPQIELDSSLKPYNVEGPNSYLKLPLEGPVGFEFNVPFFKAREQTKLTDVMSSSILGSFNLISNRVLKYLNGFECLGIESFETIVQHNHNYHNEYRFVRLIHSRHLEYIDSRRTTFCVISKHPTEFNKYVIHNEFVGGLREDLVRKIRTFRLNNKGKTIVPKTLYLNSGQYDDLFLLNYASIRAIVFSQKLKEAMEEEGFTGIKFEEFYDFDNGCKEFHINT